MLRIIPYVCLLFHLSQIPFAGHIKHDSLECNVTGGLYI